LAILRLINSGANDMATQIAGSNSSAGIASAPPPQPTSRNEADRILAETRIGSGEPATYSTSIIEAQLDRIASTNPVLAAAIRADIMPRLSVVDQAQLAPSSVSPLDAGKGAGKGVISIPANGAAPNPASGLIRGTDGEVDLNLMTTQDAAVLRAAGSGMFDIPDVFSVLAHGPTLSMRASPTNYPELTRAQRWELISGNRGDRPVMLMSCRTGSANAAWVQKLSDDLGGVPVMAATSQTWWSRSGDVMTASAYWSTNGTGQSSSGGSIDRNNPGEFRIVGGDVTDFGFAALPAGAQIREIQVNSREGWARLIAYDTNGTRIERTRNW
jgi:hypothetical protein